MKNKSLLVKLYVPDDTHKKDPWDLDSTYDLSIAAERKLLKQQMKILKKYEEIEYKDMKLRIVKTSIEETDLSISSMKELDDLWDSCLVQS